MSTPNPETPVTDGAASLFGHVINVATAVIPYAAGLAALYIGWRVVRKFVK